jgi:prevent-host-death family protein
MYNGDMSSITVDDIQRDLLGYLRRVEAGESLLIVRDGRPVAEIKPVPPTARQPRPFGLCAGEFTVPDDFDRSLPGEVLREFEGR